MPNRQPTIAEYLLKKLESYNIDHIFGIPGDYVVQFFDLIEARESDSTHRHNARRDSRIRCRCVCAHKWHGSRVCDLWCRRFIYD